MQGYKLVGLAVAEARAAPDSPEPSSNVLDSAEPPLRATALWFPAIPPRYLCLNDASFVRISQSMSGYRPISWILFGACEGELLNLTGVTVSHKGKKFNICFHYDSSELQDQQLELGSNYLSTDNIEHFPIDGKGGELITTLVGGGTYGYGRTFKLRISTNRGRSLYYNVPDPWSRLSLEEPLGIADGTTIVGLFVCQVCGIVRSCSSASANIPTASTGSNHRLRCDLGQDISRARAQDVRKHGSCRHRHL